MPKKKQALRYNENKPMLSYLLDFPTAAKEFAKVCEYGANKYARHNWKQGLPITEIEDSLLRHLTAFHNGEDIDIEQCSWTAKALEWSVATTIDWNEVD